MADEKSVSGEVASGLRSIFERVGEFFHIFDLSFLVSGAMTFGAFSFLYIKMDYPIYFPFASWVGVPAIIIACYVCGLLSFAIGREVSELKFRSQELERTLKNALAAHQLSHETITLYNTDEQSSLRWLYARMWSEIAHENSSPAVLHHLMRYWAMAATYDGVAFSFIVWTCTLIAVQFNAIVSQPISHGVANAGAFLCACAAYFAFRRGANYYAYQIGDVVAHFAVAHCKLAAPPLSPK